MKRTPLQRKAALRRVGKRGREWEQARAKLKVTFERAGITTCELQSAVCERNYFLGFAHSLRRRFIATPEQLNEVLLCCQPCHQLLDLCSAEDTASLVRKTIAARQTPVILDADRS